MLPWYEHMTESIRVFESTDINFPSHLHDALEVVYVCEGCLVLGINGHREMLKSGDIALIFPQMIHDYAPVDSQGSRSILLIVKPSQAGEYGYGMLKRRPCAPIQHSETLPAEVPGIIGQLLRYGNTPDGMPVCRGYLQVLLALLWNRLNLTASTDSATQDMTHRAVAYLMQHYAQTLTLDTAAHALGMGRYQLSRLFTNRLGMHFTAYVNALRVCRAQELLDSTDLPITEIAYTCGFENPRTFNRVFLQQCGRSPSQYRKQREDAVL